MRRLWEVSYVLVSGERERERERERRGRDRISFLGNNVQPHKDFTWCIWVHNEITSRVWEI